MSALDVFDGLRLVGRLFVGKGVLKLRLPDRVFRKGVSLDGLALGVQAEEPLGHLLDRLLDALFDAGPLVAAQLAQFGRLAVDADVALSRST